MLYKYNDKIYVKPLVNKIVEVNITKKGDEYDIQPNKDFTYITPDIKKKMIEITVEDAYKMKNKAKSSLSDNSL